MSEIFDQTQKKKMVLKRLLLASVVASPVLVIKAEWIAETIATGLNNPRGIAVAPDGVYVAEAGSGGDTWSDDVAIGGPPGLHCSGPTGGITKIEFVDAASVSPTRRQGDAKVPLVRRLAATFPSVSGLTDTCEPPPLGFAATGPSTLAVESDGSIILAIGLGGPPENQRILGDVFGSIYRVVAEDLEDMIAIANIPEYAETQNLMESNPYGIALVPEGVLVADAGADALFLVRNDSTIDTVVTFSSFGQAAVPELSCGNNSTVPLGNVANIRPVPTSVAVSPTGDFYVGFLSGYPHAPGASKVLKLTLIEERSEPTIVVDNLTQVTGLDFDAEGTMFISQLSDASILEFEVCQKNPPVNGSIIKVDQDGTREIIGQFPYVNDLAVDKNTGDVYIVTNSIVPAAAGGGTVVKLTKPNTPVPDVPKPDNPQTESNTTATSAASRICPWMFCF